MTIKPQRGFQVDFLSSTADVCIGGGAAGVGKTFAELLEPLYHKDVPGFNAMVFRRTMPQITNPGGLWDKSNIYRKFNATPREQSKDWRFPSGALVKFSHLEYESNIYDHQGAEYCLIMFDELTHFTKKMFFYMLSRNRSTCGVKPYVRATCNPDPDSFVAELVEWYIDPETGYAIPDRAGVLRFFTVDSDAIVWGATKSEVIAQLPHLALTDDDVKSFTFIPGDIQENKELLKVDPGYIANLRALPEEEKIRLLGGNWKIRTDVLGLFDYGAIEHMFINEYPSNQINRYITIDAARFGNDFMTMFIWAGWRVVKLVVLTKCDALMAYEATEKERMRFNVIKGNVIVDQDGVGAGLVKLGNYKGFSGGAAPLEVRELSRGGKDNKSIKENYANRKTQFYYRFADRVNNNEVSVCLNNENVVIDNVYGVKLMVKGKVVDVRHLIKEDLKAIKKRKMDEEGKRHINTKEEQKIILKGRSPDFGDGLSLREHFEIKTGEIVSSNGKTSILDRL